MGKGHFGLIEAIGAFVILLIDTDRWHTRKYLKEEYLRSNRIVGLVTLCVIAVAFLYLVFKAFF